MKYPVEDYTKYRWFFTSLGNLVIGGRSAQQNDELLIKLKKQKSDYIVMHTSSPGSPFSVIFADINKVEATEVEQTAAFTGCFSRAWRDHKKKVSVDIFKLSQLYKLKSMKVGMWGIKGKVQKRIVNLELALTKQKGKLRAVPETAIKKSETLLKIRPGKIDKKAMFPKFQVLLPDNLSEEELLQALPAGGVSIIK